MVEKKFYSCSELEVGKYYMFGQKIFRFVGDMERQVESYPGVFSTVYSFEFVWPEKETVEIIKNQNWSWVEEISTEKVEQIIENIDEELKKLEDRKLIINEIKNNLIKI